MKNSFAAVLCVGALGLVARDANAATLKVNAGGDLQAALNAAQPGDTILVQAGATFTGNFTLPAKGGTADITVRSSALDAALPAAGVRMSPAYASQLPKIRSTSDGAALSTEYGATHWRLLFLEFLPAPGATWSNLVELGNSGRSQTNLASVPRHLTVDRCYLHGDSIAGQRRGIALNSGDTTVINSYFADFKDLHLETQAIGGWNGPGPFLIQNNYLEGAGENIMFGGSDPDIPQLVPTSIIIRRNHITKPLAWRSQGWVVKNLVEFKNAYDVLLEGNIIENNWIGNQQGSSVLITPRNQSNTAPWSGVKHVVIQNNVIRHVASGFNILGYDNIAPSQQSEDILIRNNLLYDVSTTYGSGSAAAPARFAIIGAGPKDVRFDHNTVDNNGSATMFFYGGATPTGVTAIYGFELTNNLMRANTYGLFGDGVGEGSLALAKFTPNALVLRNTLAGGVAKRYPAGNDFPTLAQWLADFVGPASGNYRLTSGSISRTAGTDGKDLGVDFVELNAAISGAATPPPPVSTPKSGTPVALPGTIQLENYDLGGERVAYHDTTGGNNGNVFRTDGVDLQHSADVGGGYNLGWTKASEWLNYTVTVATAGTYTFEVRVASNGGGGTFHIEANGVDLTGPMTVPTTGGWQIWKTVSKTGVKLAAGRQILKLVLDKDGATGSVANMNAIVVR